MMSESKTTQRAHTATEQEPLRVLDRAGEYRPTEAAREYLDELAGVGESELHEWFSHMVHTRAFDTECTNLQRQGQLALWVPSVGQEGCQVGVAHAAEPQDHIFPAYREHTVARVRGVPGEKLAALFRGYTHGGWDVTDPAHGNFHLYTLVLGAQAQHATGFALGQLLDAKRAAGDRELLPGASGVPTSAATMVFYGDGTSSQGDASEALVFAASYQTPEVFVVQNNGWAISVPVARQTRVPLHLRARGFGLRAERVDGNDPLINYAVARRFLRQARAGEGPGYIEALTYRIGAHTTSDDPTRYRDEAELAYWQERDPIMRLEAYMRAEGVPASFFEETREAAKQEALRVREAVLSLPKPELTSMFAHVYAEEHIRVQEQQEWLTRYEASFA